MTIIRTKYLCIVLGVVLSILVGSSTGSNSNGTDFKVEDDAGDISRFIDDILQPQTNVQGRTFGKRIQMMMMPIVFKLGIMLTLLIVLTVISLKGLAIGATILVLKLSAMFGKFYSLLQTQHHQPALPFGHPNSPVHFHVHNDGLHNNNQPYGAWEPPSNPNDNEHYYYKG